jgi:hypothetical protein
VNPPFSDKLSWIFKCAREARYGTHRSEILLLLPAAVGDSPFEMACDLSHGWCTLTGRVSFVDPETMRRIAGNPVGSAIFYFGYQTDRFERFWRDYGRVWIPKRTTIWNRYIAEDVTVGTEVTARK